MTGTVDRILAADLPPGRLRELASEEALGALRQIRLFARTGFSDLVGAPDLNFLILEQDLSEHCRDLVAVVRFVEAFARHGWPDPFYFTLNLNLLELYDPDRPEDLARARHEDHLAIACGFRRLGLEEAAEAFEELLKLHGFADKAGVLRLLTPQTDDEVDPVFGYRPFQALPFQDTYGLRECRRIWSGARQPQGKLDALWSDQPGQCRFMRSLADHAQATGILMNDPAAFAAAYVPDLPDYPARIAEMRAALTGALPPDAASRRHAELSAAERRLAEVAVRGARWFGSGETG